MRRPLRGWTTLVTRPAGQQHGLQRAIAAAGGDTLHVPTLRIAPLAAPLAADASRCTAAIFVSANAARHGVPLLRRHWPSLPPCYAVGPATQRALAQRGVPALAPISGDGAAALLARPELAAPLRGEMLVLRGDSGLALLGETLRERGALVRHCALYRRRRTGQRRARLRRALRRRALDIAVATSLDSLDSLLALAGPRRRLRALALCVPGPRLLAQAQRRGFRCIISASQADDDSIVRALAAHAGRHRSRRERRWTNETNRPQPAIFTSKA